MLLSAIVRAAEGHRLNQRDAVGALTALLVFALLQNVLSSALTVVTITPLTTQHAEGRETTDLCCHEQRKSSKRGERRANSFWPSEGEGREKAEGREGEREEGKNTCIKLTLSSER